MKTVYKYTINMTHKNKLPIPFYSKIVGAVVDEYTGHHSLMIPLLEERTISLWIEVEVDSEGKVLEFDEAHTMELRLYNTGVLLENRSAEAIKTFVLHPYHVVHLYRLLN
jgi:hypothetical protein